MSFDIVDSLIVFTYRFSVMMFFESYVSDVYGRFWPVILNEYLVVYQYDNELNNVLFPSQMANSGRVLNRASVCNNWPNNSSNISQVFPHFIRTWQ